MRFNYQGAFPFSQIQRTLEASCGRGGGGGGGGLRKESNQLHGTGADLRRGCEGAAAPLFSCIFEKFLTLSLNVWSQMLPE